VLGGWTYSFEFDLRYMHQYNPENSTWNLIRPKGYFPFFGVNQFCLVINNKVFVSCGVSEYTCSFWPLTLEVVLFFGVPNNYLSVDFIKQFKVDNELHVLNLST